MLTGEIYTPPSNNYKARCKKARRKEFWGRVRATCYMHEGKIAIALIIAALFICL